MLNKVILIGNLGRAPQITDLKDGSSIANMSLATSERRKDSNGEYVNHTEWHHLVAFGHLAKYSSSFVKGQKLYIEGRLRTRKFIDKQNIERWTTEIVVDEIKNLTPRHMIQKMNQENVNTEENTTTEPTTESVVVN